MNHILIVEDDIGIADYLSRGLASAGYATDLATDGHSAVAAALTGKHALIVLDLNLPGMDGIVVLNKIREAGIDVPVIVLSARTSLGDRLSSLGSGANDYMPKPFEFAELLARIRLRLGEHLRSDTSEKLHHGDLVLNLRTHSVLVNGRWVELTHREMGLIETFMRNPGRAISRAELLSEVWNIDFDPGSNVVDVYVRTLRKKIGAEHIETVRGLGYRLR